ncbi:MAG: DnaD domain protein [Clostridia bacterium]|nr:DnaD domain protein [Clostridia bacterium]
MSFLLNPVAFSSSISVPGVVVDNFLRIAGAVQLKVLLFSIKNATPDGIEPKTVGDALGISEADAKDALNFWADAGVLISPKAEAKPSPVVSESKPKTVVLKTVKPTRSEIARRGAEQPEIAILLREAQNIFGRALKQSEASTLVWLYDDEGMGAELILTLLEYAKSSARLNIGFIERTGVEWINNNVQTMEDANRYLNLIARKNTAWSVVQKAFGLEKRMPSKTELELSDKWVNEYKISKELLREAYNMCVDSTGKFSMQYIKKIIENWHSKGVKTVDDIAKKAAKPKSPTTTKKGGKNTYSTTNITEFEKFIDNQ